MEIKEMIKHLMKFQFAMWKLAFHCDGSIHKSSLVSQHSSFFVIQYGTVCYKNSCGFNLMTDVINDIIQFITLPNTQWAAVFIRIHSGSDHQWSAQFLFLYCRGSSCNSYIIDHGVETSTHTTQQLLFLSGLIGSAVLKENENCCWGE